MAWNSLSSKKNVAGAQGKIENLCPRISECSLQRGKSKRWAERATEFEDWTIFDLPTFNSANRTQSNGTSTQLVHFDLFYYPTSQSINTLLILTLIPASFSRTIFLAVWSIMPISEISQKMYIYLRKRIMLPLDDWSIGIRKNEKIELFIENPWTWLFPLFWKLNIIQILFLIN